MKLLLSFLLLSIEVNAQPVSRTINIGNFKTTSGQVIRNCIVGYSTIGQLNADKSNVVLWPTWITAKSEELCAKFIPLLIDTAGLYIIVLDALGNGYSSSPTNNASMPAITIRDMVNSQHQLLTKHLGIHHAKLLIGGSMGGMQVMEWIIAYPGFADYAVSIAGSPKFSPYDLLLWKSKKALLAQAVKDKKSRELGTSMASNLNQLNLFSPTYWNRHASQETIDSILQARKTEMLSRIAPADWLCHVNAVLVQDIYKGSGMSLAEMKDHIKAKTLIIVSKSDLLVNPQSSIDFAKGIGATLLELEHECGHVGFLCDPTVVNEAVGKFIR